MRLNGPGRHIDDPDESEGHTLFEEQVYVDEATRKRRLVPAMILLIPMLFAFIFMTFARGSMIDWAISGPLLARGRFELFILHMFAHGGIAHIAFNGMALVALGPLVMERLGPLEPRTIAGFLVLFFLSGLGGAGFWLAINPSSEIPMLGASGAIFGLLGFIVRKPASYGPVIPLASMQLGRALLHFVQLHLPLIALFLIPMLFGSGFLSLAWEAHLGGFIAGLLLCDPLLRWCDDGPDWVPMEETDW